MKNNIIIAVVFLLLGGAASKFLFPTIKEKIVEKEVEVIKKDIQTIIKEIIRPDGTKEIVTVVVDKSQEKKESSRTTIIAKEEWHASLAATSSNLKDIHYQIQIERRIIGNIHIGALVSTQGSYGLAIGYSF